MPEVCPLRTDGSAGTSPAGRRSRGNNALRTVVRRTLLLARAATGVMVVTALVWSASVGTIITERAITQPRPHYTRPAWSPAWAEQFPGCGPIAQVRAPAQVIEVRPGGIPVRVDFDDAWRRTHDSDPDNHGDVVAGCR